MPSGWECKARLIKQCTVSPTVKRKQISAEIRTPGPNHYEVPVILGGSGYSNIKRAPAYTLGKLTSMPSAKQTLNPLAPVLDTAGWSKKGKYRVTHGLMLSAVEAPSQKTKQPGPNAYNPHVQHKKAPAYSCRQAAKPAVVPWDKWSPSPNMYWPPIFGKKHPAFTLGCALKKAKPPSLPGPGAHDPNFHFVEKGKPAFSFGSPFKPLRITETPAPNAYCEKKFAVALKTPPAVSFGIRHSKKRGEYEPYLKPSSLDLMRV